MTPQQVLRREKVCSMTGSLLAAKCIDSSLYFSNSWIFLLSVMYKFWYTEANLIFRQLVYFLRHPQAMSIAQITETTLGWTTMVQFPAGGMIWLLLFATTSRPALGPTQPPIQWVSGVLFPRIKRQGRECDHLPPSSAKVNNAWSYTSTPPKRLYGVVLS